MKTRRNKLFALLITLTLIATMIPGTTVALAEEDYGTQRAYIVSLILDAGMKENMIGTDSDQDALAKSLGFLDNWDYNPTAIVTSEVKADLDAAVANAYNGLRNALSKRPLEPYFVNGLAQPIFNYGNSIYKDTTGEGVVRYVVYVETDLDTDDDGKLDLVKTLVQLPRAALEGGKFSTIYEARPYIEGTGSQSVPSSVQNDGNGYLSENPEFSHEDLYKTAPARIPAGETTTAELANNADYNEWYYRYSYSGTTGRATISPGTGSNETEYEDLNWYDYHLVRGFAIVQSAGIGSAGSEGYASCGADIEINAFKAVIEWLTGDRRAYSDKTANIEIKADWSNGNVGMTGRSYSGTTQFALATSGVEGLKTIVPVAGIASWYEYTNSQGVANSIPYSTGLAWYVNSRVAASDWSNFYSRYAGFSQIMRQEENALVGDYGEHWRRRDYTVENWYKDWGPSKIHIPMLIVHGANDDNVRPKQSVLMYEATKKAGVDVRWIWHQGHHMTPTFPKATPNATDASRPYSMYCGDYLYDEWLNLWFSHHLYGVDNGVMEKLPGVLALDNDSGEWVSYDSWDAVSRITLKGDNYVPSAPAPATSRRFALAYEEPEDYSEEFPIPDGDSSGGTVKAADAGTFEALAAADGNFTIINSANGGSSWQNYLTTSTAGNSLYVSVLPDDVTVRGVVKVDFRAAINSLGANANEPLRVHAKLVEIAAPGTTLKYYGGNAVGSTIAVDRLAVGGAWQGGGAESIHLAKFRQTTTGTYRELAKGWMDLCNPEAGYDSHTASRENRIVARENIGVYHDYTLFLQPTIHTAKAGNKLALIITTGGTNAAAYTGNNAFTFSIDNAYTKATIPTEPRKISVDSRLSINVAAVPVEGEDFAPTFKLTASDAVTVQLLVASYDAGRLADIAVVEKTLTAGEEDTIRASLSYQEGLDYRFYLWDDVYIPLTEANTSDRV
jgi:X-Pro dipeptidyl-peptidase